jgi:hypothetical protein
MPAPVAALETSVTSACFSLTYLLAIRLISADGTPAVSRAATARRAWECVS